LKAVNLVLYDNRFTRFQMCTNVGVTDGLHYIAVKLNIIK